MSASMSPTRLSRALSASAKLAATVDLPTPPLPLATATTCLTPGSSIFGGAPAGGRIVISSSFLARVAFAQRAQVFQGVNARVVPVVPDDLVGVMPDRLHRHRLEGRLGLQLARLEDAERVGRLAELDP